jgi:ATP-dependent Lhr-like helicase
LGPVTQEALSASLSVSAGEMAGVFAALQTEGFALCGRFTPGVGVDEWCERRLLARVHHYTVKRLRAEIEPVAARDFLRFLSDWQRVSAETRMEGSNAVEKVVGQLEGFEAPAAAWEAEILPTRLANYQASWLDDHCRSGRITWTRLRPRANGADSRPTPVRTTPITLLTAVRGVLDRSPERRNHQSDSPFSAVLEHIQNHGASFFDELLETRLLRSQIEEGLAELVALGLVTSDSFAGLRALLVPSSERRPGANARRRRRTAMFGIEDAGRWALTRRAKAQPQAARQRPRRSESPARCSIVMGSCSGGCSSAKPPGFLRGVTSCASTDDWKVAVTFAAAVLLQALPANSSPCRRQSACCARCAARNPMALGSQCRAPIRSIWWASSRPGPGCQR